MKSKKRQILVVGAVALCVGAHAKADDLDSKSIQVEQQFHGRQWVPLDPLPLDHGTSYQGYAVGMPDNRVKVTRRDTRPASGR